MDAGQALAGGVWEGRVLYDRLPPDEKTLADALLSVADQVGEFDLADNIWVGYESEADNEDSSIGVRCDNCAMWEGDGGCLLLLQKVEAGGMCRFAIIPPGEVGGEQ